MTNISGSRLAFTVLTLLLHFPVLTLLLPRILLTEISNNNNFALN